MIKGYFKGSVKSKRNDRSKFPSSFIWLFIPSLLFILFIRPVDPHHDKMKKMLHHMMMSGAKRYLLGVKGVLVPIPIPMKVSLPSFSLPSISIMKGGGDKGDSGGGDEEQVKYVPVPVPSKGGGGKGWSAGGGGGGWDAGGGGGGGGGWEAGGDGGGWNKGGGGGGGAEDWPGSASNGGGWATVNRPWKTSPFAGKSDKLSFKSSGSLSRTSDKKSKSSSRYQDKFEMPTRNPDSEWADDEDYLSDWSKPPEWETSRYGDETDWDDWR